MQASIQGGPTFAYIHVDLEPGESVTAESDAMTSMSADLDMQARLNGGLPSALAKKFLGQESFFVNDFTNNTSVSGISREGFFKLNVTGPGTLWYGAYGALVEREVDGEYIVDTSHLVGYEPQMKLKLQMAGGIFSSVFGKEGLVTRVEGKGKIIIQSRSLSGLAGWVRPHL